ncbi:hypothetical protein J6G99_05420 [bacterium]|nr:hypothetical protein [bacterium]
MSENILLVTDKETDLSSVIKKLSRENDKVSVISTKDLKKYLNNRNNDVVILHSENNENTFKLIELIKKTNTPIILALDNENPEFILQAYDNGIFDYFVLSDESYKIMIKLVNCFKFKIQNEIIETNKLFLDKFNSFDDKYDMYKLKYFKEIFPDLNEEYNVRNGYMCLLTLEEDTRTKISLNRLAGIIKKTIRKNDICAVSGKDLFYILLKNTNFEGAKCFIQKIQNYIGNEIKIRAGISKIGIQNFNVIQKNLKDSLEASLKNNEIYTSFTDSILTDDWLENNSNFANEKHYKLFKNAFDKKLNKVILPIFFRFQKEYSSKLKNVKINQYANNIECVFSLKDQFIHSELTIRFDGFTKLNIEISHTGLNTPETTKFEIPMNKFDEHNLIKFLKQLKNEHCTSKKEFENTD